MEAGEGMKERPGRSGVRDQNSEVNRVIRANDPKHRLAVVARGGWLVAAATERQSQDAECGASEHGSTFLAVFAHRHFQAAAAGACAKRCTRRLQPFPFHT